MTKKDKKKKVRKGRWFRRLLRVLFVVILFLVLSTTAILLLVQTPWFQTKAGNFVIEKLNEAYGTKLKVSKVYIDFWGDVNLYDVSAIDNRDTTFIHIPQLILNTNLYKLTQNQENLFLDHVTLIQPRVKVYTYEGETESNFIQFINAFDDGSSNPNSKFTLDGDLDVANGTLKIINYNLPKTEQHWLDSKAFNAAIKDFRYNKDSITANLKELSFITNKKGEVYSLEKLATKFTYTKQGIDLYELNLKTGDSEINGRLNFAYKSLQSFNNFNDSVVWDMKLNPGSKVAYRDIRYWVANWDKVREVGLAGEIKGPLRNWDLRKLNVQSNGLKLQADNLKLSSMDDLENLNISAKGMQLNTSQAELKKLLPTFLEDRVPSFFGKLGKMNYVGGLDLDQKDLKLKGALRSGLGQADLDLFISNYSSLDNLSYSGKVKTDQFDLKGISGVQELDKIQANLSFEGSGSDLESLSIKASGKVGYIDYNQKRYENILLDGVWHNEMFEGFASVNDKRFKGDYEGALDISKTPYKLDFVSNIRYLDLATVGVTKERALVSGKVSGNMNLSNINDFLGNISLEGVNYRSKSDTLYIAKANLASTQNASTKTLSLTIPNRLDALIQGEYVLTEVPDAILNTFADIIPNYREKAVTKNQVFTFKLDMQEDLISRFYPDLKVAANSILEGEVDTNQNETYAILASDSLSYSGIDLQGALLRINTRNREQPILIETDSLNLKGIVLKNVQLHAKPLDNEVRLKTNFYTGSANPVYYDLELIQSTDEQGNILLNFAPSLVTINDTPWNINPDALPKSNLARLNFESNEYYIEDIRLENGDQNLAVNGFYYGSEDYNFKGTLNNLLLQEIIPREALGDIDLRGIAQGDFNVKRSSAGLEPIAKLSVSNLFFNGYELGDLLIDGVYDEVEDVVNLRTELINGLKQELLVQGIIDNKPEVPELSLSANFNDLNLAFLGGFLNGVVSKFRGTTTGNLEFDGPISAPNYNGNLTVNQLGFKVDYLNVEYLFDQANLPISKEGNGQGVIYLNELVFEDQKFNTQGSTSGVLLFRELSQWYFNLSFNTEKLLVLNTTERNNELFFGKLFGKGNFHFEGTPNDLKLSTDAELIDNSNFTINTGSYFVDTNSKLVRFVPNKNSQNDGLNNGPSGLEIEMKIAVTPSTNVALIFDSSTNDMLEAKGTSKQLTINMNSNADLSMEGEYVIESGQYRFRRIPGLTKDFNIEKGSSIQWAGSPYDATLDISALYAKIVSNVGDYLGVGFSQAHEVFLEISMSETLAKPVIGFDLDIPKASNDIQSQLAQRLNTNPDEQLRQFGFILLTGQFGTLNSNALASGFTSAAAEVMLRQISNVISAIAKEFQIDFNYTQGDELSQTSDRVGARVSLALHPRWTLKTTGGIPLDNLYNEQLTLEVEAEYDLSDNIDRSVLITGFSRPTTFGVENFNNATASTQSYGGGISFTKSFDRLGDLFKSKERIRKEKKQLDSLQRVNKKRLLEESVIEVEKDTILINDKSTPAISDTILKNETLEKTQTNTTIPKKRKKKGLVRFR